MSGLQGKLKLMSVPNAIVPIGTEIGSKKIPLTKGMYAIVDADDYDFLSQWKWGINRGKKTCYAVRMYKRTIMHMHRIIMNTPKGMVVDHLDHNGLNNQKENMRNCTNSQNTQNMNRSRYQGVSWNKNERKYTSKIGVQRKRFHLGYFNNPVDAAIAYNRAALIFFGPGAKVNILD